MPSLQRVPSVDQLLALTTAAAQGSMGVAARRLEISQQAVSARITAAEGLLGVVVLERSTSGVRPTGQGQLVLTWAQQVIDAAGELEDGVAGLRAGGRTVVVAASNTVSEALLPAWASQLRQLHPDVTLEVVLGNSRTVLDAVAKGEVDLGYVETPHIPRGLRSKAVARDELVVVTPPDHPWARRRRGIDRAELSSTRLVLREDGSGTRTHVEEAMPGHAPPLHTLPSTAAVRDAVRTMSVPTILSTLAVEGDLATGRLVRVPVRDLAMPRTLRAVWNPNQRPRGPAADLLHLSGR
ncbi:LysR family transcriptional regulator [Pedococcus sp. KACC 23699]|uniref:LysR family transcriptional regulator n=1 Tax=Pedococcus sp. KACC 23699 TaxID=3149228 RepID=A0AAU7JYB0_9MICO